MATLTSDGLTTVGVYHDGLHAGDFALPGALTTDSGILAAGVTIGHHGSRNLTGVVDDLALWNRVLSAAEVETIYDAGVLGQNLFQAANPIPEPSTFALLVLGLLPLGLVRRRRRRA